MPQNTLPAWKHLRDLTGLPQSEIERRCGWSRGRLSVIERGLIPTDNERATLARVLMDAISEKASA